MFPSEMVILMAIATTKDSGRRLLTRPMDITGEYIGYLYDSLVHRGYLVGNSSSGYRLTFKGQETLIDFLYKNDKKVEETLEILKQLGIRDIQEKNKLEIRS